MNFRIALRNVFRHRARSLISVFAIVAGCSSVIFAGAYFEDTFFKMRESYIRTQTGHLQIYRKGFSENGRKEPFSYLVEEPDSVIALVKSAPGVSLVTPRLQFAGVASAGENSVAFMGQGIDEKKERTIRYDERFDWGRRRSLPELGLGPVIESGRKLDEASTNSIFLGRGLAAALGVKPGDSMTLLTTTVGGSVNAWDVAVQGIFFTGAKAFDDRFLRLPIPLSQNLLRTRSVQSFVVLLKDTNATDETKRALEKLFAEKRLDLEIKTWYELDDFYTKTKFLFERMFVVLKIVIGIIVTLSIYNTMNMSMLERTAEIGTIRALGKKRKDVLKLFLQEGALLGVIGGLASVVVGGFLTWVVSLIGIPMPPPPGGTSGWLSEPMVTPSILFISFMLAVVSALASSWIPAYRASRLEIAEALRTSH